MDDFKNKKLDCDFSLGTTYLGIQLVFCLAQLWAALSNSSLCRLTTEEMLSDLFVLREFKLGSWPPAVGGCMWEYASGCQCECMAQCEHDH